MNRFIVSALIVFLWLTSEAKAQPSFKQAVLAEAGMSFAEVFFANIFNKKSISTALKNAAIGATAASLLHQSAWQIVENPRYALAAQLLFVKGDDVKGRMIRGEAINSDFFFHWKMRYLFLEIDPLRHKVNFRPGLLSTPLALSAQGLFSDQAPKLNLGKSLKSGTFFYGDYRSWHQRQLIWGGQVVYGQ
jgi:hypothetical protein